MLYNGPVMARSQISRRLRGATARSRIAAIVSREQFDSRRALGRRVCEEDLASYRNAVERYCKFRRETSGDDPGPGVDAPRGKGASETADDRGQLVGLERDLQAALRRAIGQLEPGLEIIDDGAERSVASGFVDITARDSRGAIVVIELKTGTARQGAVAQVLSYMGDIADEEPDQTVRGVLVAGDFDKKARSAARVVPDLSLRSYRVSFEFQDVDSTARREE